MIRCESPPVPGPFGTAPIRVPAGCRDSIAPLNGAVYLSPPWDLSDDDECATWGMS